MRVAVIMSNDYPADVVPADQAEARCQELRKQAHDKWVREGGRGLCMERYKGSGNRWIRAYEFDMKAGPNQSKES